jgi:hypothetical protein
LENSLVSCCAFGNNNLTAISVPSSNTPCKHYTTKKLSFQNSHFLVEASSKWYIIDLRNWWLVI